MSSTNQSPYTGDRALNEMIRKDPSPKGQLPTREMPESVSKHFIKRDNAYFSANLESNRLEMVDRGNRMHAYRPITTFVVRTMAETAELRGWKEVELTGDKVFKQSAFVELQSRGIQTRGYDPTAKDAEILETRALRAAAKDNPLVQAFQSAATDKDRKTATKNFPQLAPAFAAEAAAVKYADQNIDSRKAHAAFVARIRDQISVSLHTGKEITVDVRQAPEKQQSAQRDAER